MKMERNIYWGLGERGGLGYIYMCQIADGASCSAEGTTVNGARAQTEGQKIERRSKTEAATGEKGKQEQKRKKEKKKKGKKKKVKNR